MGLVLEKQWMRVREGVDESSFNSCLEPRSYANIGNKRSQDEKILNLTRSPIISPYLHTPYKANNPSPLPFIV